jgi:hypothetical protein
MMQNRGFSSDFSRFLHRMEAGGGETPNASNKMRASKLSRIQTKSPEVIKVRSLKVDMPTKRVLEQEADEDGNQPGSQC